MKDGELLRNKGKTKTCGTPKGEPENCEGASERSQKKQKEKLNKLTVEDYREARLDCIKQSLSSKASWCVWTRGANLQTDVSCLIAENSESLFASWLKYPIC